MDERSKPKRGGRGSPEKGGAGEREFIHLHDDLPEFSARRVYGQPAMGGHDVDVRLPGGRVIKVECKRYKRSALVVAERICAKKNATALASRGDRGEWWIALRYSDLLSLLRPARSGEPSGG